MCQQNDFKPCKYITNQYIDSRLLVELIDNFYKVKITERYAKTIITQSKGCVKCFFTRLIKHLINAKEITEYFSQKEILKAKAELYILFFKTLFLKGIIKKEEYEFAIKEYLFF